jgi:PTS system nitrogen regulatory IIA component
MKISDFLAPTDVVTDVAATDKENLLLDLARNAASKLSLSSDQIFAELSKREALGSTGIGGGVAIPHARFRGIKKPFGMFVRLKKPMDYDAVDSKPVDLVVLLLLPETAGGEQLGALATIARKLRDPEVAAALRRARASADLHRTLTSE